MRDDQTNENSGSYIHPKILKDLKIKNFPLMFSILKTICENKKLEINW